METDEGSRHVLPFQLQFDKPLASQVKMAEWNPEKDLLAVVTEDSKVVLHRFNWQRLWTISPGYISSYAAYMYTWRESWRKQRPARESPDEIWALRFSWWGRHGATDKAGKGGSAITRASGYGN
ncbi:uncharacterized protein LOC104445191 [Eucalyptus grandis]|uniref:uncharacterized protein LOC104445191 n=1 Tax=Eucalyptus grandis TaxID=71139 RepID=UPI00192E935E|nr:uncharacterized protein LOC104445191 [Eucalyptus grandis]